MDEPRRPKIDRTWLTVGLLFVVFWTGYLIYFNPLKVSRAVPRLAGSALPLPADYGWRLLDLDGKPVEFARYRGRAVFLNVWATWCPPCVGEMPGIARLAADPRMKDVAFVCVSNDDDADTVKRFLAGKDWPMTVLRATDAPPVFATKGIPATFLIAPDGRIVASHVGGSEWDDPAVISMLEDLSREKTAGGG